MGRDEGELEGLLNLLRLLVDGGEGLEGLGDGGVLPDDLQAHLLSILHVASRKPVGIFAIICTGIHVFFVLSKLIKLSEHMISQMYWKEKLSFYNNKNRCHSHGYEVCRKNIVLKKLSIYRYTVQL